MMWVIAFRYGSDIPYREPLLRSPVLRDHSLPGVSGPTASYRLTVSEVAPGFKYLS